MALIYGMNDVINVGKNKKIFVSELVKMKGEIFKLIKNGMQFDDEVLANAHIKKTIRDVRVRNVFSDHEEQKTKKYSKETESLKNILKSLNTIDKQNTENLENQNNTQETESFLDEEE